MRTLPRRHSSLLSRDLIFLLYGEIMNGENKKAAWWDLVGMSLTLDKRALLWFATVALTSWALNKLA
jgi:hypothetical protein